MIPEIDRPLAQGQEAFARGDLSLAERCFTQALRLKRDSAEVYGKLGAIYHQQGRFTEAVKLYARALELAPKNLEARLNLGVLLCDLGRYEHAGKLLAPLKKSAPFPGRLNMFRLAEKHMSTGDAYRQLQLYDHARVEYEHAAKLRPNWPELKKKLAVAYRRLGRYPDAIRELEAAGALDPKDLDLQTELAICCFQSGDRVRALGLWQAVLLQAPNHDRAARFLLLAQAGNPTIAKA
jgi:Flp pilus assembly protein TadD